jgi:iron(III) transport system substrate-binding protein
LLPGCWSGSILNQVVVYTALDDVFSEPILADFARESGIEVLPKFDAESTKTLGLTTDLIAEAGRPRCDVFWNNEILNTLRLEAKGRAEVDRVRYESTQATVPPQRDTVHAFQGSYRWRWIGLPA